MERLIFHIDVNSAFLSWEAARRVEKGEPDLRLVPSAIGGDRDKRTGIILAKSIPAKKFGIKTGEPVSMALRKCPDLILAKPDFHLYVKNSKAFIGICEKYAPIVEQFSIDECFLDLTGTGLIYPDPIKLANTIKDEIRSTLGFTVNVGIGRNKLCAKMASDFTKPDRVHTLWPEEIRNKMWPLPVGELFSIGKKTEEKLRSRNIKTIGVLANTPLDLLQKLLGNKPGQLLHNYANGIDDAPIKAERDKEKSYSVATTLEENVTDEQAANKILLALSDSVAARLRKDQAKANCVAITIRYTDFKNKTHQRKLSEPTNITSEIYNTAKALLKECWNGHAPLRLMGVSLMQIDHEDAGSQISLFQNQARGKEEKLDHAVDVLRGKYGKAIISRAAIMDSELSVGKKYQAQIESDKD